MADRSLWHVDAPAAPPLRVLDRDLDTDVLVIGGGIAGLSTALHLAEAGVAVVLVEAAELGSGATGQSGGLIAPDYIRHSPDSVVALFGSAAGERLNRMVGGSAQACFDLIARHAIDCDAAQDGFWSPAPTEAVATNQRRHAGEWQARGYDVHFAEAAETAAALGVARYVGALRFGQGGSINPLAFARGLAAAAIGAGTAIFTDTPVTRLDRTGDRWQARVPRGTITARRLVLAANGGNAALHAALGRTVLPLQVVEFATAPLSAAQRAEVLPHGGSFTDKSPYVFTARFDGAGRLISAFPASFLVRGERALHREARRRLAKEFAALGTPEIACLWEGTAWINPSILPEIYDLGDDALVIQACNGRGLASNAAIGRDIAAALVTVDRALLPVAPRLPVPVRLHAGAALMPKALMTMAYLSN